jgi:hypothetical protein
LCEIVCRKEVVALKMVFVVAGFAIAEE